MVKEKRGTGGKKKNLNKVFVFLRSRSHVWVFVASRTVARQAPLSFTISQSLRKFMSIESVMQSNHLILCHPLLSITFNLSQHQGIFQWVGFSHQVAKVLEFLLQHQSFQWVFRVYFLYNWLVCSPCSPRDSENSSPVPQFEIISSSVSALYMVQSSHSFLTTGKTIAVTIWSFEGKVMSLLFNMLSRFVTACIPRSKCLLSS